ncbi:MAG: hypothetical protein K0Q76_2917 [Panacagrimonas sp.]|nr:lysophospholipid acyltransferase family protein [Panacagrimonas sp.]MCC2657809.1 hypothetical protein [Panacagrimonas sp.]
MNHRADAYAWRVAASGLCLFTFGLGCLLASALIVPAIALVSRDGTVRRRRIRGFLSRSYAFFLWLGRALGVISFEIHGAERLSRPGQLIVANHPSLIDMLFVGAQVPLLDCIVKASLSTHPGLRAIVHGADYIPNGAPAHLVRDCAATLHAGHSLLVFPEGTRSRPGQPLSLTRGAARIALAARCDLLPVTIVCQPSSLTKSDVWYRVPASRPHWRVMVDEPIALEAVLVAGESPIQSARRLTDHLGTHFATRIAACAVDPSVVRPARAIAPTLARARP